MKKVAIITLILAIAALTIAYPTPSKAKRPGIWTLDTQVLQPQQIAVRLPGQGVQRFWYTIVTVTNDSFDDVRAFPQAELMTDTFEIILAGQNVPGFVFDQIKQRHASSYPFLESLESFDRRVLQGDDNTRDIAIIWPQFDTNANNVKMFIAGLSNEIAKVTPPDSDEEILLRKTLQLDFSIGGDPARRGETAMNFEGRNWIMR